MHLSVKASSFRCLAVALALGGLFSASAFNQARAGAPTSPGGDCYTRKISWTHEAHMLKRSPILVRAEVRWVRICGQRWVASVTITNTWSKSLWWSHGLSLQPRFSREPPQEQLLPRSDATFWHPAPPHVL